MSPPERSASKRDLLDAGSIRRAVTDTSMFPRLDMAEADEIAGYN